MTFFANAEVQWPSAKLELRRAGTEALSGGSGLWSLISELEGEESERAEKLDAEEAIRKRCVDALEGAASMYSTILESDAIDQRIFSRLTIAEGDLAGVPFLYFVENWQYLRNNSFAMRELYYEMMIRIQSLASQVRALDLRANRSDLAPLVFRAVQDWEVISQLSRIIAVLNRRSNSVIE